MPSPPKPPTHLQSARSLEVRQAFRHLGRHGLLAFANPDLHDINTHAPDLPDGGNTYSWVVLLLVRLVGAFGIADLSLEIVDVLRDVVTMVTLADRARRHLSEENAPDTRQVRPLQVRVDVHLDHTML